MKNINELVQVVEKAVRTVKITDIHTHLFSECFGSLFLYGIDELLTYHYLVAEAMRQIDMDAPSFYSMSKSDQAQCVWDALFIKNSPVSEPARSIITIFNKLGLDVNNKDLNYYREYFRTVPLKDHIDRVFDIASLKCVVMTNDPLDKIENAVWESGYVKDDRFKSSLRVDRILNDWENSCLQLKEMGFDVHRDLSGNTVEEIKRFLIDSIDRMEALYCAVSLPPDFSMLDGSVRTEIIESCILPVCRQKNMPFALMIGVKRAVNPELGLAGDSLAKADIKELEYICSKYKNNKFLVTLLSLENQHELVITARKFSNLMIFGCWWYLNSPYIIDQITRIRLEWLGTSFIPQHSDCRVFEQLISKWEHSKTVISKVLAEKYGELAEMGYNVTEEQILRDVENLFGGNFWRFCSR
ncbi:MAG TPA: glucuronate isomerase [Pseudobacteroides sp.]|nr:glucuronate isomerase [Pseudobacteroides sp.]